MSPHGRVSHPCVVPFTHTWSPSPSRVPGRPHRPHRSSGSLLARVHDVGQGDATLLEFPCGAALDVVETFDVLNVVTNGQTRGSGGRQQAGG